MSLRRYRLSGSASSTTAAVDSMSAVRKGKLKQIIIATSFNSITDGARTRICISTAATDDGGTASAGGAVVTQTLAEVVNESNFVTSGLSQTDFNRTFDCNDDINIGTIIYLHIAVIAGTVTVSPDIILVVEE